MAACHSRDQIHDVEVGFDDEGRHPRLARPLHCRLRRLESARRRHRLQHCRASDRPLQVRQFRRPCAGRRDQQGAERALSRRRTAGGHVRDGAGDGSRRRRARPRAGRCAAAQHDPRRRDAVSSRHSLSRRRADRLRQRRLSGGAAAGARRASAASRRSGRARTRRARRAAISVSASAATSRAPASARSKAPPCGSIRPARSMLRPAPARRVRAWRRSSRRSSPMPGRSSPTTSSWRSPTPRRSRSASARSRAAAR